MKKTLKYFLVIMVLGSLSMTVQAKDVITTNTPEIYDQAIAKAEKQNAIVDTIEVMSVKMGRTIKNTVVLPAQYTEKKNPIRFFPVVYLLHGAQGSYRDWPKKADLRSLASQYGVIIVCPDGQDSWYFDSPIDPKFQFETYVVYELRNYIETHYRTLNHSKYRAITGLSMGGHGALWLAWRHPDLYGSCGSMSGAVDIMTLKDRFKIDKRLGKYAANTQSWRDHSVINLVPSLKNGEQNIIIDDGTQDFLIKENRALHAALDKQGIKHNYSERPGRHSWDYWVKSLTMHLDFFAKHF